MSTRPTPSPTVRLAMPSPGLWWQAWTRFRRRRFNRFLAATLLALVVFCALGPGFTWLVWGWTYDLQQVRLGATAPSLAHPFGTDALGRDLMVRTMHGGRVSLLLAALSTTLSLAGGITWGAVAGMSTKRIDALLMRTVDMGMAFPFLLLAIVLVTVLPVTSLSFGSMDGTFFILVATLALVGWLHLARIVRGQVILLREREFVLAARATGVPPLTIVFRHILPNSLGTLIVYTTLTVPTILVSEAFLSFLGLGIREPHSSWGTLLRDGTHAMSVHPWLLVFPATVMILTLAVLNLLGDALRDAFDPRFWTMGGRRP